MIYKEVCQEEERIEKLEKAVADLYNITESLIGIAERSANVQRELAESIKNIIQAIGGRYGD